MGNDDFVQPALQVSALILYDSWNYYIFTLLYICVCDGFCYIRNLNLLHIGLSMEAIFHISC